MCVKNDRRTFIEKMFWFFVDLFDLFVYLNLSLLLKNKTNNNVFHLQCCAV